MEQAQCRCTALQVIFATSSFSLSRLAFFTALSYSFGLLAGEPGTKPETGFLSPHIRAKGVVIPLYAEQNPKPVAVVRVERILNEYQRHGFFRIGLLPEIVAEGVSIDVLQPSAVATALGGMRARLFTGKTGSALEIRRVSFRLRSQSSPLLEAKSLQFDESGRWRFRDGVLAGAGGTSLRFVQATLTVTGPLAGEISANLGHSTVTTNPFSDPLLKANGGGPAS